MVLSNSANSRIPSEPKKACIVSELQLLLKTEGYKLGFDGRWWSKPDNESFADRFYISNSIRINDSETKISIYYLFKDPSNLKEFEIKVSTKELLGKEVYAEVRSQISEWLRPLTDTIISLSGKNDNKKVLNIKTQEVPNPPIAEDIPF